MDTYTSSTVPALAPVVDTAATPPLSERTLADLPSWVAVPDYDRSSLTPAVVHIGVGGFHRAHQAVYFDDLARLGFSADWGIVGVGLHRPQMGQVLSEQDNLYAVVVRGPDGDRVRVVGALVDYLFAPENPEAVLAVLAAPSTRLVTLSITGSAYGCGEPDLEQQEVRADVERPEAPGTAFGYLVEALDRRRRARVLPFTVLSCDNVEHNGEATRRAVLAIARLRDPELGEWIEQHVSFPSSMVDRITPETTRELRDQIVDTHGVGDRWPVITEPFSQWIVQDDFCNARPPLENVGVQFVTDVRPYELMKTRMLNGAHSALGYLARLSGLLTTDEAMSSPVLRDYVDGYLAEAAALLPEVPGIDLAAYRQTLLERFSNSQLSDQTARLCRRGSTKVPSYVLPSLELALALDQPREHLVLAVAGWFRFLRGVDYDGRAIEVEDVHADRLRSLAVAGWTDPRPLLTQRDVFGSLADNRQLAHELEQALYLLETGPLEAAAATVSRPVAHIGSAA
jgi:fructuronate reductase/mannitol 2-dehydrogenase